MVVESTSKAQRSGNLVIDEPMNLYDYYRWLLEMPSDQPVGRGNNHERSPLAMWLKYSLKLGNKIKVNHQVAIVWEPVKHKPVGRVDYIPYYLPHWMERLVLAYDFWAGVMTVKQAYDIAKKVLGR